MCRGGQKTSRDKSKPPDKQEKPKVSAVKETPTDTPEVLDETAGLGQLTGNWFLLNGLQPSPNIGPGWAPPCPRGLSPPVSPTQACGQRDSYEVQDEFSSALRQQGSIGALSKTQVTKMRHHMMDEFGRWTPSNVQPHGKLLLQVSISQSAASQFDLPQVNNIKSTPVSALADTGAQMCVADWRVAKSLGLKRSDLLLPALSVSVADNSSLELIGAHFLTITAKSGHKSEQLVYFASDIGEFYLSKAALIDLAVIDKNLPLPGSCPPEQSNPSLPHANHHEVDYNEDQTGPRPRYVQAWRKSQPRSTLKGLITLIKARVPRIITYTNQVIGKVSPPQI